MRDCFRCPIIMPKKSASHCGDMDSPRAETATALAPSKKHEPPASRSFLTWGASRHCPPKPRGGSGFPLLLTFSQAAVLCLVSLPFHPLCSQLSSLFDISDLFLFS